MAFGARLDGVENSALLSRKKGYPNCYQKRKTEVNSLGDKRFRPDESL
jgi:hypothetical protein